VGVRRARHSRQIGSSAVLSGYFITSDTTGLKNNTQATLDYCKIWNGC